ncbi:MAG: radical SAM protein [Eubacterium sp.]|jgi:MoaA/NifB/PqqE/SkfB family radical SAM enzyme
MASMTHKLGREAFSAGFEVAYSKLGKDRQSAVMDMLKLAEKYLRNANMDLNYEKMEKDLSDPDGVLMKYINRIIDNTDKHVLKTFVLNFGYEALLCGTKVMHDARAKYKCNIPWLILMDPTSACNLRCTGCWAAEYGHRLNLTVDEINKVIKEGKELGVFFYMYTGGEPLVRKDDLIKICEMNPECQFVAFTNGTLVDEAFCKEMKRVGNLALAISLEGSEDSNDQRRGQGVYQKVMHAMDLLRENGLIFGTSICYTKNNYELVTSDEFINMEIEKGVLYSMYFHYMPVGNDASPDLMLDPEQRKYMIQRIRKIRSMEDGNGLFVFDFQNDGEYVGGCIAGGRNYFHINANGDAEPCVFIHYSNMNIREHSLLEILQSPLFMAYHNNQPFNDNQLRPCPMLENPEILPKLVKESGAKSTDLQSPETPEHLCAKTKPYAENWKPYAEEFFDMSAGKTKKSVVRPDMEAQK